MPFLVIVILRPAAIAPMITDQRITSLPVSPRSPWGDVRNWIIPKVTTKNIAPVIPQSFFLSFLFTIFTPDQNLFDYYLRFYKFERS